MLRMVFKMSRSVYSLPSDVIYCAISVTSNTEIPYMNSPGEGAENVKSLILNCNGCNRKCYFNVKIKGAWVSLLSLVY